MASWSNKSNPASNINEEKESYMNRQEWEIVITEQYRNLIRHDVKTRKAHLFVKRTDENSSRKCAAGVEVIKLQWRRGVCEKKKIGLLVVALVIYPLVARLRVRKLIPRRIRASSASVAQGREDRDDKLKREKLISDFEARRDWTTTTTNIILLGIQDFLSL